MAKVDLFPDFRELFKSLNSANVEYLLIGGYAVIYYGYRRVTDDLDILIAVNAANAHRVSDVLRTWGGFNKSKVNPELFLEPRKVFIFGREPVRIDILTGASGLDFEACYGRRKIVDLDGISVPIIALSDLLANKAASGRPKDLADLEYLSAAAKGEPTRPGRKRTKRTKK